MIRTLALCAIASPTYAQDAATFCDGLGEASIAADGDEYVVTLVNPLCPNTGWMDDLDVIPLSIDGMAVTVQLWSQPNTAPDTVMVLPPPGWLADPAELVVDEHETGIMRLVMVGLS